MKINALFDIEYGQREYHSKSQLHKGNIPLISSSKKNNGLYGLFDIAPKYKNIISVPNTGSNICEAFYHDYQCCIDDNCLVLKPKSDYSLKEMLFFILLLRKGKTKYISYGRQVTPERIGNTDISIKLFPKWLDGINEKEILKNVLNMKYDKIKISNSYNSEKFVNLDKIFDVYNGLNSNNLIRHNLKINSNFIPYIRPSNNQRNSIDGYIDKRIIDSKYIFPKDSLYVSTDGQGSHTFSYVCPFEFIPNSNVSVLIPKQTMGLQEKLYYALCITKNRPKFSYGRKPKGNRLKEILILDKCPDFIYTDIFRKLLNNWKNII